VGGSLPTLLVFVWLSLSAGAAHSLPPYRVPVGWNELHHAASSCNPDKVRELIAEGLDPDSCSEDGFSPMSLAVACSPTVSIQVLETLRISGASMEAAFSCGRRTPMHWAAIKDNLKAIDWLLARKIDIDARGADGSTALHAVVSGGQHPVAAIEHLLQAGANTEARLLNRKYKDRRFEGHERTPLHIATRWRRFDLMRVLLKGGAKVDSRTDQGKTPLHLAAESAQNDLEKATPAIRLLLENGADPNALDNEGETALRRVLNLLTDNAKAEQLARLLIAKGTDLSSTKILRNYTYLGLFSERGNRPAVEFLLDAKANIQAPSWDQGLTPLHLAAHFDKTEMIDLLLARGAKLEALDGDGNTPLHHAAAWGKGPAVERLIAKGANIKLRNKKGQTPLFRAAQFGRLKPVQILAGKKVCLDEEAEDESTPISAATSNGHADVIQALLDAGAKPPSPHDGRPNIIEREKKNMREHGLRAWARVIQRGRSHNARIITSTGEACAQSVRVRLKTPAGKKAIGVICYPFKVAEWKRLQPGARLEVVYLPASLMNVGEFLVAAEIIPVSFIDE
jgi:ankyrin repeat protein